MGETKSDEHIEVVETRDGSKTLYDRQRNLHYRSVWGAAREARYVFLEGTGLVDRPGPWTVLELGFGAAVNFCQTVEACLAREEIRLDYHAVEYAPVDSDKLAFQPGEAGRMAREALATLADVPGEPARVTGADGRVSLTVYPTRWREFDAPELRADAVYYDPFGPRREPESWSVECIEVARRHMADHAVLATYSAASQVKRTLFAAGLHVGTAPGLGAKREVTFAALSADVFAGREEVELSSRSRYLEVDDA